MPPFFTAYSSLFLAFAGPFGIKDRIPPMLPSTPDPHKPKLLEQVRAIIRFKYYSLRTEHLYIDWIKRFILFHGKRHPNDMGGDEIRDFLTHLATKG
jgi:integrase